jgi:transposase
MKHILQIIARFPRKEIILFIDHYPSHETPKVLALFKANPNVRIVWMPKYSPKLNIIESVWKELKKVVGNWFFPTIIEMERAIWKFFRKLWSDKQKTILLTGFNEKYLI